MQDIGHIYHNMKSLMSLSCSLYCLPAFENSIYLSFTVVLEAVSKALARSIGVYLCHMARFGWDYDIIEGMYSQKGTKMVFMSIHWISII